MSDNRERQWREGSRSQSQGPQLAPNVKPKLGQKERSSKEDQLKREKTPKPRRSRSIDSERGERGRRRERDRHHREWRQRGRSEEARRRDRKDRESDRRKVKPPEDDVEETECAICFCSYDNIFRTPKLLVCGHTFCLECLARINVTSPELKTLSCPVCRELTEIPHGKDLPRLGNNEDIISKLPADMQRVLSIRFKRNKGKLVLKNPPPTSPTKATAITLPKKSQDGQATAGGDLELNAMEQSMVQATVVDVGRPPSRVRGRLRRLFRSDRCYYAVVVTIIVITASLMLVGILAFVIVPNMVIHQLSPQQNQTSNSTPGSGGGFTRP
ncbi:E3 ubiquitin-protein ligase RNF183 [Hippoglossus hippoglossus]|uniref:E3 ubiquitin-protein ligase RNF183 n=1 Tax=Hippoglossus hippoglossus TaxID=8267 RepID=UPI00148D7E96|nr:E3 ubiquitin-protein ligase RNF183 [Hippoglossus hippoglossus]